MFTITKTLDFSAAHHLTGLNVGHQCARVHGHNYLVTVEAQSETLDAAGFVVDYGDFGVFATWLKHNFDHRYLNEVIDFNPSAELLAKFLLETCQRLVGDVTTITAVTVQESGHTSATYRP